MVSVVIPIHNVEKYIDRELTNILKQTYQDYEVILVDDGSTDGSPTLCNAWAERYGKIRVLHKENGGAGSARNLGIENAQGEYIYFFDIASIEKKIEEYLQPENNAAVRESLESRLPIIKQKSEKMWIEVFGN